MASQGQRRHLSFCDLPDDVLAKIFHLLLPSSTRHITLRHLHDNGLAVIALALSSTQLLQVARSLYAHALHVLHPCPADDLRYTTDTPVNHQFGNDHQPFTILRPSQSWAATFAYLPFLAGPNLRQIHIPRGLDAPVLLAIMKSLRNHCAHSLTEMFWYDDIDITAALAKSLGRHTAKLMRVTDVSVMTASKHTLRHTLSTGFPSLRHLTLRSVHPMHLEHVSHMLNRRRNVNPSPGTSPEYSGALTTLRMYISSGAISFHRKEEQCYASFWTYIQTSLLMDTPKLQTLALCTGHPLATAPPFVADLDRFDRSKRTDLPAYTTFEVCTYPGFSVSTTFADQQHTRILPPWRARSHSPVLDYHLDALLPLLMFTHGADQYGNIDHTEVVRRMRQATILFVSKDSERLHMCLSDEEVQRVKSMYQQHCTKLNAIFVDFEHGSSDHDDLATQAIIHVHRLLIWNRGRIKFCSIPASVLATNTTQSPGHMSMLESFASAFASSSCLEILPRNPSAPLAANTFIPSALRIPVPSNDDSSNSRGEFPQWDFARVSRLLHALVFLARVWTQQRSWAQQQSTLDSVLLERIPFRVGPDVTKRIRIIEFLDVLRDVWTGIEIPDISSVLNEINNWLDS